MKTMPYPVRLPSHLLELADIRAATERVDRSTALRQLLYAGAVAYVLDLVHTGRISLSKAGELLNCGTLDVLQKARERGMALGATAAQYTNARRRLRSKRPAPGS